MTYIKVNVTKPTTQSPGKGGDKKNKITFIDLDDLVSEASRDSKGIVISGNHQFKDSTYAIEIYATIDSISGKANSEGDIDAEGMIQEVLFAHPGSEKEVREFRSNWLNRNIMIIVDHCLSGIKDQYGSICAPLRMKLEATDDKEQNKSSFTFTSAQKGPDIGIYEGTITLSSPVATVPEDATSVDLSSGEGEYQMTDGSVAPVTITTCTNVVDGMVFTLLGSGGSHPSTITDANDFILKNGTSWSALANSTITFKAYKDGAATWKFIEQSRT